jgi:hypothetical protein
MTDYEALQEMVQKLIDSKYATGFDLSKWNSSLDFDLIDFKFIAPAVDYVMWRLGFGGSDGRCYEDSLSREIYAELEEYPEVFRIGYWYQSSHVPWRTQFDFLCKIIDSMDVDMIEVDGEKYYNVRSPEFARDTEYMMDALIKRYPDKKIVFYSNFYVYRDWFRAYRPKFDTYLYHQAQYPYAAWTEFTAKFMLFWDGLIASLKTKPYLPPTRKGKWLLWQFVDRSGLGKFFGVGSPNLDFNISLLLREAFFDLVRRPARWFDVETPEPIEDPVEEPVEEALTVEVGSIARDDNSLTITINIGGL